MKKIVNVDTGEVKSGGVEDMLVSNAIGSCIVLVALDVERKTGALAHVMLAGKAPFKEVNKTKYAVDAIDKMLEMLNLNRQNLANLKICLVGAGNVLKNEDDTICNSNIQSVMTILNQKQLNLEAKALGGTQRRSVRLDVENGEVYFTEGDSKEKLLCLWSK